MDIAQVIGERDGEAFSDRPKTGVSDDPGFDPPLSFDAMQSQLARMRFRAHWRHSGGLSEFPLSTCAVKGGVFQWVRGPPGNRSSRKQPGQAWRRRNV
jgi:hypothetical protein